MDHYRNIRIDLPEAEALPFWGVGTGDSDTEDLAAWLRDMGGDGTDEAFRSSVDASWLGVVPGGTTGNGSADGAGGAVAPGESGAAEAGA